MADMILQILVTFDIAQFKSQGSDFSNLHIARKRP